jgi:hypothetical protein
MDTSTRAIALVYRSISLRCLRSSETDSRDVETLACEQTADDILDPTFEGQPEGSFQVPNAQLALVM